MTLISADKIWKAGTIDPRKVWSNAACLHAAVSVFGEPRGPQRIQT